jgi:hypothetical protein
MLKESILNVEVSCFANYNTPGNAKKVNLLTWLTSTKYQNKVEAIRAIDDKKQRDAIKATLPAITPSGIFSKRSQSDLITHSGLIQIDIDSTQKNLLIPNWEDLKAELINLPNIAYLGKSVSGRGYWGLIPIPAEQEDHKKYFDALAKIFLNKWGIELDDKPKNVASLRGYSYDPEGYFNHQAVPFILKMVRQITVPTVTPRPSNPSPGLGDWIIRKLESSQQGGRHGERLKLARYAGGLVTNGYLNAGIEERLIQSYLSQYGDEDSPQTQAKEIKAFRDGYTDGLKYPIYPNPLPKVTISKKRKVRHYPTFEPSPIIPTEKQTEPDDYITQLHIENGLLINGDGYPADWDLTGSYTDKKTKDFIRMAVKNPALLQLRKEFDIS